MTNSYSQERKKNYIENKNQVTAVFFHHPGNVLKTFINCQDFILYCIPAPEVSLIVFNCRENTCSKEKKIEFKKLITPL